MRYCYAMRCAQAGCRPRVFSGTGVSVFGVWALSGEHDHAVSLTRVVQLERNAVRVRRCNIRPCRQLHAVGRGIGGLRGRFCRLGNPDSVLWCCRHMVVEVWLESKRVATLISHHRVQCRADFVPCLGRPASDGPVWDGTTQDARGPYATRTHRGHNDSSA